MNFHEETINKLVERLEKNPRYLYVLKNVEYNISEMDVVAVTYDNYMLVFEVKSSENARRKAYSQLDKHKKTFGKDADRMFRFYVYPKQHTRKREYKIELIKG